MRKRVNPVDTAVCIPTASMDNHSVQVLYCVWIIFIHWLHVSLVYTYTYHIWKSVCGKVLLSSSVADGQILLHFNVEIYCFVHFGYVNPANKN